MESPSEAPVTNEASSSGSPPAPRKHWGAIYNDKEPTEVSWFEARPNHSLELIRRTKVGPGDKVIDVGAGASRLVDTLLDEGLDDITVLDISEEALNASRERLGKRASSVSWVAGDVLSAPLHGRYMLWHDRALFHFLRSDADRRAYIDRVHRLVEPGGYVIIATFADDGPEQCSGLPVVRYSPERLAAIFGHRFTRLDARRMTHRTPSGAEQRFVYVLLRRHGNDTSG